MGKADSPLTSAETAGVLRVANEAPLEVLDLDVPLDARAARGIVAHRFGVDGRPNTADDQRFATLEELDAVPWVGPVALGRLLAYAHARGLVEDAAPAADCLIISEYIERGGLYNKAIELYNCGAAPVDLAAYEVCLVRNDDRDCTVHADLGTAQLGPGAVTTMCRRIERHPASLDPSPFIADRCELERAGAMTFNGDDRLLVRRLDDGTIVDALGRVGYRPPQDTWADIVLQRCNFTPADGVSFYDHADYFLENTADTFGYGAPPVAGCAP
ncbi:MAG TPA: hypothetical protein VML75_18175 [Kofleriaceae bacterium]|nr:hypothetical protein [Kofleriaceae bacterium]